MLGFDKSKDNLTVSDAVQKLRLSNGFSGEKRGDEAVETDLEGKTLGMSFSEPPVFVDAIVDSQETVRCFPHFSRIIQACKYLE